VVKLVRRETQFQRAADGSMTLLEHLRELRSRLFKGALGVLAGMVVGFLVSGWVMNTISNPYCDLMRRQAVSRGTYTDKWLCPMQQIGVTDIFVLKMQLALWVGLILAAPIWLYQLWAFIAPGLHKNERRWAYTFAGIAAPLFATGAILAYFVVAKGLEFLLNFTPKNVTTNLEISNYVKFITNFMLLFGAAFEFPLVIILLNVAGIASARRLLGWWRIAVFLLFAFAAVTVPTPDPFGMGLMGLCLTALYFAAVLFAYFNDKRRARKHRAVFGDLDDDEISPLDYDADDSVESGQPIPAIEPVAPARPLERGYDDVT
jgi:sec-independent protein translocase protein TatC